MTNQEIEQMVRECGNVLPFNVYASICSSDQIDHIKQAGDWIDLWANDGQHWQVKVRM